MQDDTTYYPHPKLKPLSHYDKDVRGRIQTERAVCRKLIRALHAAGYKLRVVSTDDYETKVGEGEAGLMRALFNLDDAFLVPHTVCGTPHGWVRLVFGNDGWDVVSDYTTDLEPVLAPVNDYADSFSHC